MDLELRGKTAIVTGASRGLGAAIAAYLAFEGMNVCLAARDVAALEALAAKIKAEGKGCALVVGADLRSLDTAPDVVDRCVKEFGALDVLVNNAGAAKRGDFFSLSEQDWDDGYALKFRGYVRMARAAWPALCKRKGCIVNVIGVGGRLAMAEFTIGGSINSALLNFTKALAEIGQRDGVRVNAVNPGRIETDRLSGNIERLAQLHGISRDESAQQLLDECGIKRFGRPEEIAWAVAFLASARASYMQGALVDVDGFETKAV
jgi:NAD(P)-dependent dehydrogenase (short-subunit alcohol dehydrogenase family)